MDIIYAYTRMQAINDGVLVDVSDIAREAGLRYPTSVTRSVWEQFVRVPEAVPWQDEQGRLWDILWMLRCAIQRRLGEEPQTVVLFEMVVNNDGRSNQVVDLKAVCGPGDDLAPVLTIMLPEED